MISFLNMKVKTLLKKMSSALSKEGFDFQKEESNFKQDKVSTLQNTHF